MALTSSQTALLNILPEDYNYLFSQEENINDSRSSTTRTFRMELTNAESVQEWITKFADRNNVIWRKSKTSSATGRYVLFKANLRCQHNSDKRSIKKGTRISKNTNCPAKLKATLYRYLKNSRARKPVTLNKDWPCLVELIDDHNHSLTDASALRFQDLSQYTKDKLLDLYKQGHTPSTALKYLKAEIFLEHPEDYETLVTDGRFVPTLSVCSHLFNKEIKETGNISDEKKLENLRNSVQFYNENSRGKAILENVDCQAYVSLCSPIMQRAHKYLQQSSQVVLVDVFGGNNPKKHRAFFLVTSTPAGAIPLGVIITNIETEIALSKAFENLKKCFPDDSFFGKSFPSTILIENNIKGCGPLQTAFPNSEIMLCQFRLLKSVWSWLCSAKNEVEIIDRQKLYFAYKELLHAQTDSLMNEYYKKCLDLATTLKYPKFIGYLEQIWKDRSLWSSCLRTSWPKIDQSYIDIVFRVLNNCILDKVSGFGINQLFDFITDKYEGYIERWLTDFCRARLSKSLIKMFIPSNNELIKPENIVPHTDLQDCFLVIGKMEEDFVYNTVDIKYSVCSCTSGKICFHIASVIMEYSSKASFNMVTDEFKEIAFKVATGSKHSDNYESDSNSALDDDDNDKTNKEIIKLNDDNDDSKIGRIKKNASVIPDAKSDTEKYLQYNKDLAVACHSFVEGSKATLAEQTDTLSQPITEINANTNFISQKRNGNGLRLLLPKPKIPKTVE